MKSMQAIGAVLAGTLLSGSSAGAQDTRLG